MKELKRSIEIDPDFLYSHEGLAVLYFNQKRFYESKSEAEFIINLEPDNKIARDILRKLSE